MADRPPGTAGADRGRGDDQLLDHLLERRRSYRDLDPGVLQVDVLREGSSRTLLVEGEVLVARSALERDDRLAQRLLDRGLQPYDAEDHGCEELRDRVARYRADLGPTRLVALARELRSDGVAASVDHVLPLADAVIKGGGGPAQTQREMPEFARYRGEVQVPPGDPPRVAVIDTGIAAQPRHDGWLDDGLIVRDTAPVGGNVDPLDAFPAPGGDSYLDLAAGHGTFVCGVLERVCPGLPVTVYSGPDSDGIASELQVACLMVQAVRDGADILNLSLGCRRVDGVPPIALVAAVEAIAQIEREQDRQVLLIAAAGNIGSSTPVWPAAFRRVVAVGSLTADGAPSSWSSYGGWVDASTIGEGIVSTYVEGREDPRVDPTELGYGPDPWAVWSGTSFAAPQLAGAVARLCLEQRTTPRQALAELLSRGTPLPGLGQAMVILPGTPT